MGQGPSTVPGPGRRDEAGRLIPEHGIHPQGAWSQGQGPHYAPGSQVSAHSTASTSTRIASGAETTCSSGMQAPAGSSQAQPGAGAAGSAGHNTSSATSIPMNSRAPITHRSTTLIPCWSRPLSSQQLHVESQRVALPLEHPSPKDTCAVLDLEVMKFVAYCGGVTVRFKVDELQYSQAAEGITWGLASTRPCPALMQTSTVVAQQTAGSGTPGQSRPGGNGTSPHGASAEGADTATNPSTPAGHVPASRGTAGLGLPVDSISRKALYTICTSGAPMSLRLHDIATIDLAPKEDKQPVILATLRINDVVVMQSSLPCSAISALQMYPFITLAAGMTVSLHEAVTPSPLFTWYASGSAATAPPPPSEVVLTELDTCIRYASQAPPSMLPDVVPGVVEFTGSTTFSSSRHRWTVQLDNYGTVPTYVFVGVAQSSEGAHTLNSNSSNILFSHQGPLRSIAGTSSAAATSAAAPAVPVAGPSGVGAPGGTVGGLPPDIASPKIPDTTPARPPTARWGSWVRLPPGPPYSASLAPIPQPPRDSTTHVTEATSAHCFVTVDLDLANGYVRFFRNGHIIGSAFQGIHIPVSPVIAVMQIPHSSCQAGLVNLTKLRQHPMLWDEERCSGDLKLTTFTVSKVSEVFGDYSTVLATEGFISGVHLWLIRVNHLSEPDSIFIGVCRGCMPLDQDPQDLRDRTYYLSNGVIRVGGRRVATNAAQFTKGDVVGVVLDADQGEVVFFRNGVEQGRARGIRGRLYPFVSCDSEADQISLIGSYDLLLDRIPRQLADMEWDTLNHAADIELSSNCLTAIKGSSSGPSTVRGTILYEGSGVHEYHVILDSIGPDGIWVGVAPPDMDPRYTVGDEGCGWALHSDGDKRHNGRETEYTGAFNSGDVLTVCVDMNLGVLRFSRNGTPLGDAFTGLKGPLVSAATLASEESKVTIQNRPTVLNTGEYVGELRWDEARAGKDLHVIDGLTVTKMANEGGDYATVLGTLCLASGQHAWNVYINHVEDSNLFIGVAVGGHDLNADPQEMKHRTYYLSNGTIRVAGKLMTRCAEPYAEGDLITVQLDMDQRQIRFLKNGVLQGMGDSLPEEVWPYISLDNIMDSITLHSSTMFIDLVQSLRWNPERACRLLAVPDDGSKAQLRAQKGEEMTGQGTVLGLREYSKIECHSWVLRIEQSTAFTPSNFLVGVAPPNMDLNKSLGEEGCGIGLDFFGYFYVNGRYFHVSNLHNWAAVAKPVRGSTAKHKGKALPIFTFLEGRCEIIVTLDLKEGTLKFSHGGRSIGTIAGVKGPLHAAVTLTSSRQKASLSPGPIGKAEHTNEELVSILKAKGCVLSPRLEAALLLLPRDLFVPRDRHREAYRDQKVTVRMSDGSTMTLPPPSFVASALERLGVGRTATSFLDVGCGTGYVTALAACLIGDVPGAQVQGIECVSSRLEAARANMRTLRERLSSSAPQGLPMLGDPLKVLGGVELTLSNVLVPECTEGQTFDALYCDAALSEEDLPTFLALLKPNGRMVVIIEEEATLVTRGSADPHDFSREVITHVTGDYGELEEPTPWEVQEAIVRIKEREHRRGFDQAKADISSLRSFEYVEMQQRVQAAMQRISELEAILQRSELNPLLRSPVRSPGPHPAPDLPFRSPVRPMGVDDVRVMVKDKSRRVGSTLKPSPRTGPLPGALGLAGNGSGRNSPLTPGVGDSGDWKAMYTTGSAGPVADANATSGIPPQAASGARARARELLTGVQVDQASVSVPESGSGGDDTAVTPEVPSSPTASTGGMWGAGVAEMVHAPSGSLTAMMAAQVSMSQHTFEDIIDSMSVQMFSPDQIQTMISGREPMQVESRELYMGTYKGVRVRVWRVTVSHIVSYFELKRAYSKYCIAHPNIAAVLGVCIQASQGSVQAGSSTAASGPLHHMPSAPAPGAASASDIPASTAGILPTPFMQHGAQPGLPPRAWSRLSRPLLASDVDLEDDDDDEDLNDRDDGEHRPSEGGSTSEQASNRGPSAIGVDGHPATLRAASAPPQPPQQQPHILWVVEEAFGEESLHARLERGLLSWQQACRIATDICKALAFLQDLKRHNLGGDGDQQPGIGEYDGDDVAGPLGGAGTATPGTPGASQVAVLSAYALRTIVTPANVSIDAQSTKVSVLPALLNHLENALCFGEGPAVTVVPIAPLHCDMAYIDPHSLFSEASAPSFYAFGVVLLQLLTEQGPLGLLAAVKEALESGTLMNLVPRLPANAQMAAWAEEYAALALKCTQPGAITALETELLPALEELAGRLGALGSSAMSWEQVEEMLMLPLQPRATSAESASRRWVRQDFRMRRKMFLEEVAKLAAEGPVHKIEVRRARCFKDTIAVFAGKGHTVWRQPLKVTFLGEAGMDSGGVTREWFSTLSNAISRGSPELFCAAGPQRNQLYINPLSSTPTHLKKFQFVGLFMAKAILESSARGKELGPITLNLPFSEPLWKLLLGIPLSLMDLQQLDPTEFRSLMSILDMDIDGLIFETFTWNFHHTRAATGHGPSDRHPGAGAGSSSAAAAGFGVGAGYVGPLPSQAAAGSGTQPSTSAPAAATTSTFPPPPLAVGGSGAFDVSGLPLTPAGGMSELSTPTGAQAPAAASASPFAAADQDEAMMTSIPLKPGGNHLKVTNHNKREYVLLKAHKMLVGTIEAQMTAVIDAFHSVIPRDLIDKYSFTSLEMQLLVCGEQRIDIQDLRRHCKYEDGYSGNEPQIAWFWEVVEAFDDAHRRQLLQFWSGSDGMPAEGFGALDPAFHIVAVERLYDAADTTARLPAAHTCFRQLDLPRYRSMEELRDKTVTAITIGQGYMALS